MALLFQVFYQPAAVLGWSSKAAWYSNLWQNMGYACMVDLIGRTGNLTEAYCIVRGLPCKPAITILESLLGACRIHGNVELGVKIGGLLSELDPENSRPHVMLHNIYAAAGRWTDADRIRSRMEERRLKKLPGFSLH
ncbi:hypothetical protein M0R45_004459 [Rubus argutus]|uniref:Pentatricopeptide repeat-containing protein n=1 Tax=Rubus argutus TaxID=59490 RepID=A0AAW1YJT1_RUBAR